MQDIRTVIYGVDKEIVDKYGHDLAKKFGKSSYRYLATIKVPEVDAFVTGLLIFTFYKPRWSKRHPAMIMHIDTALAKVF